MSAKKQNICDFKEDYKESDSIDEDENRDEEKMQVDGYVNQVIILYTVSNLVFYTSIFSIP